MPPPASSTSSPTSSTPRVTASPAPASPTAVDQVDLDPITTRGPAPNGFELVMPDDPTGAPTVVFVHGGAWVAGSPSSLRSLAQEVAERGAIAINLGYSTLLMGGGYPRTFDEIACGIRQARAMGDQLGGSGELVVVGHSAGAHLALVVALDESAWGQDCPFSGSAAPDRFVGLAGFYDIDQVDVLLQGFLGGPRTEIPQVWDAVDPYVQIDRDAPGVGAFPVRLHVGDQDTLAPIELSRRLSDELEAAGADASTAPVAGADHFAIMRGDVSADLVMQE